MKVRKVVSSTVVSNTPWRDLSPVDYLRLFKPWGVKLPKDHRTHNYDWMQIPVDTYSVRPPLEETKLVRKSRTAFEKVDEANEWARDTYDVVERLHTVRTYCWRVMKSHDERK
jgi:hypothetical protein